MNRQMKPSVRTFLCLALVLSPCLSAQEPAERESVLPQPVDTNVTDTSTQTEEPSPSTELAQDIAPPDPFIDALNRALDEPSTESVPEVVAEPDNAPRYEFLYFVRVFSVLLAVSGLIILIGYLVRKLGKRIPLLANAELGTILGRLYLARGTTLHFVKTGGRVLVLGITNNSISLLKEFAADEFDKTNAPSSDQSKKSDGDNFLAQFEERSRILRDSDQVVLDDVDEDMSSLRGDIRRLREFIKKDSSETED